MTNNNNSAKITQVVHMNGKEDNANFATWGLLVILELQAQLVIF